MILRYSVPPLRIQKRISCVARILLYTANQNDEVPPRSVVSSAHSSEANTFGRIGIVLWSLSVSAGDWQSSEKLTRLCTIPEPAMLSGTWDRTPYAMEARILRPLLWFGLLEHRSEKISGDRFGELHF